MRGFFDKDYFREMMKASRERVKKIREEVRKFLAASRSKGLDLVDVPKLDKVPGLVQDLDNFVRDGAFSDFLFDTSDGLRVDRYRSHILSDLGFGCKLFTDILHLGR